MRHRFYSLQVPLLHMVMSAEKPATSFPVPLSTVSGGFNPLASQLAENVQQPPDRQINHFGRNCLRCHRIGKGLALNSDG